MPLSSPQQAFSQAIAQLNAEDPTEGTDAMEQVGDFAAELLEDAMDSAIEGMGMRRGTDEERLQGYTMRKPDQSWQDQRKYFPRDFHEDALDAYKLGAPLPAWVTVYALGQGAEPHDQVAQAPKSALAAPPPSAGPVAPAAAPVPGAGFPGPKGTMAQPTLGLPLPPRGFRTALVTA